MQSPEVGMSSTLLNGKKHNLTGVQWGRGRQEGDEEGKEGKG